MNCYSKLGVKTIINASETYTNLGGSLMEPDTLKAMQEAGKYFLDYEKLRDAVCERSAKLTKNDAAFVTTGAAGGLELSVASCMCLNDVLKADMLPNTMDFKKNEIIILAGEMLNIIPYWKLIGLTGAKIMKVEPDLEAIKKAINDKTAACVLFPATLYERDIPTCEEIIPIMKKAGIKTIVDAAAQLPPASNLWYYTKKLGANLVVFSGGKHIKGPQSTGLIVGDTELIDSCKMLASPNSRLGRAFKTGKEELVGFLTALETFVSTNEESRFYKQKAQLLQIEKIVKEKLNIETRQLEEGRLGTYQPLLLIYLPAGFTAKNCNEYTRGLTNAVDVGVYPPEFRMPENVVFLNAYNLQSGEEIIVANAIIDYVQNAHADGNKDD